MNKLPELDADVDHLLLTELDVDRLLLTELDVDRLLLTELDHLLLRELGVDCFPLAELAVTGTVNCLCWARRGSAANADSLPLGDFSLHLTLSVLIRTEQLSRDEDRAVLD